MKPALGRVKSIVELSGCPCSMPVRGRTGSRLEAASLEGVLVSKCLNYTRSAQAAGWSHEWTLVTALVTLVTALVSVRGMTDSRLGAATL